jgi:hypothetical protein
MMPGCLPPKADGAVAAIPTRVDLNSIDHSYVLTDAIRAARCVSPDDALRGPSEVWREEKSEIRSSFLS